MPPTMVIFYRERDGACPYLEWLSKLPERGRDKVTGRVALLGRFGHELRRPQADYLRDGIYELRASAGSVQYRVLYFFHGRIAAIVSHGIIKTKAVPAREIEAAIDRKSRFEADPQAHGFKEV